jgi:hypothetical protein
MTVSRVAFPTGQNQQQRLWPGGTFRWRLFDGGWTPDESTEVVVADIPAGHEITAPEYLPLAAVPDPIVITLAPTAGGLGFIAYPADDPDFGILSGGDVAAWLVLEHRVTTDADSELCSAFAVAHTCDGVADALFTLPPTFGTLALSSICSAAF